MQDILGPLLHVATLLREPSYHRKKVIFSIWWQQRWLKEAFFSIVASASPDIHNWKSARESYFFCSLKNPIYFWLLTCMQFKKGSWLGSCLQYCLFELWLHSAIKKYNVLMLHFAIGIGPKGVQNASNWIDCKLDYLTKLERTCNSNSIPRVLQGVQSSIR